MSDNIIQLNENLIKTELKSLRHGETLGTLLFCQQGYIFK